MIHKNNLEDIRYRKRRVCEDNRRKGNVNKKWKQMKSNENKEEEKNKHKVRLVLAAKTALILFNDYFQNNQVMKYKNKKSCLFYFFLQKI